MTQIGLGLAALGRPDYINIRENHDIDKSEHAFKENAFKMLDTAYKQGIRYFDTAPSYGKGENFLLEWQKSRNFQNTTLATKWGYTYVANWEIGYKGVHEIKEHSIEKLIEQWEFSKKLLPNLKVYQVHSATFESGILENTEVLEKLAAIKKETGLLIGLTTSGTEQASILKTAAKIKVNNASLFDVLQVTYNIFEQSTHEILSDLILEGKRVVIKEGVANGRIFNNTNSVIKNLALKYDVGIDAVALRFIIDSLKPYIVLSGSFSEQQLESNLKALKLELSKVDLQLLKDLKVTPEIYWKERKSLLWN